MGMTKPKFRASSNQHPFIIRDTLLGGQFFEATTMDVPKPVDASRGGISWCSVLGPNRCMVAGTMV